MALDFAMSGGNFIFSQGTAAAGIWLSVGSGYSIVSNAPGGRTNTYAFADLSARLLTTPNLGTFAGMIAGVALYPSAFVNQTQVIIFEDSSQNNQCDLRVNGSGQLLFTRNGTQIGSTSTFALTPNVWSYIEFKALFATGATGTCEVRVNGAVVLTATSVQNATTTATASIVAYGTITSGGANSYLTDFYVLDTVGGANTTYLGDVTVKEIFPNAPGVHQNWAANVGPFTLTSVDGSGNYTGTITGGGSNAYQGYNFNMTGFVNSNNNATGAACTGSSTTTLSFSGVTTTVETHAGTAAFQAIVQPGINATGTRPNQDVTYISDSTTNDVSDFSHTALVLTGAIFGVVHQSYMRKDDAGTRSAAQVCLSSGTTTTASTVSLGNTYQYYQQILETDPHTGTQWNTSGFNAASFGVKEIT